MLPQQSHPFLLDKSFHTKLSGQPSEQLLLGNFLLDELSYCVKVNIMASWSWRNRGRHYRNYPLLPKIMITIFFSFRADYLKMYRQRTRSDLEGFTNFMAQGVRTEYLESVFPAESFPAWQTIQTGETCKIPGAGCISQIIDSLSEVLSFDPLLREIGPK